jgi:hypothetical protein
LLLLPVLLLLLLLMLLIEGIVPLFSSIGILLVLVMVDMVDTHGGC